MLCGFRRKTIATILRYKTSPNSKERKLSLCESYGYNMFYLIKKMRDDKKEFKQQMARVKKLPEDYRFVFEKISHYMWSYASGDGYDMLTVQYELIELLEAGASQGKHVLEITGEDVAAFCDDLLRNTKTYTEKWRKNLNRNISKKLGE